MHVHLLLVKLLLGKLLMTPAIIARVRTAQTDLAGTLQEQHRIGLSEFEVLEQLAVAEDDHCRMQRLCSATHLSQSALSRLIGRLEQDGLVERKMCSEDRRGIFASLTPDGRTRYEQAKPTQRAVLAEQLGS